MKPTTHHAHHPASPMPHVTPRIVVRTLIAGVLALIVWEVWARLLTPLVIGEPLDPSAFIRYVIGVPLVAAQLIHVAVGVVIYPAAYVWIVRPILRLVSPAVPWWVAGLVYGVVLWVFALYVLAFLVAGLPPFLGFGPASLASLAGHLLYSATLAGVLRRHHGVPA